MKQRLADAFKETINQADALVDTLAPIFEAAESPQELELAYIVRGQKNILRRMKDLMESARREITILIQHPTIAQEIKKALEKAEGSKTKAAELLQVSFDSLRYRIEKLDIR